MIKKLILIVALFCSVNSIGQTKGRKLYFAEYSANMAVPIILFNVLYDTPTDKKLHFTAGYLTNATVGYILRKKNYPLVVQILGGLLSGYAIGYLKEGSDKYLGTGVYSKQDINATASGSTVAMFTFLFTIKDKREGL